MEISLNDANGPRVPMHTRHLSDNLLSLGQAVAQPMHVKFHEVQ